MPNKKEEIRAPNLKILFRFDIPNTHILFEQNVYRIHTFFLYHFHTDCTDGSYDECCSNHSQLRVNGNMRMSLVGNAKLKKKRIGYSYPAHIRVRAFCILTVQWGIKPLKPVPLRRTSTRARTRSGRVAEANYHFGILSADKCRNQCSLCIDCRSVLGINPEGIKTVHERNLSGISGQVAEWMRIYKIGFHVLSASCPRPLVDVRSYELTKCKQDCLRHEVGRNKFLDPMIRHLLRLLSKDHGVYV